MLLIVKGIIDDDDVEDVAFDDALSYADGSYVSGNTPCKVVDWSIGQYVRVAVSKEYGEQLVKVPLTARSRRVGGCTVTVHSYGLKPYLERVVDLAQGLEWDGLVHVVATKIFGCGKFYVAITRAKSLANLKVSGVEDAADLRNVVRSNWRALLWLHSMGEHVPEVCLRWALGWKSRYEKVWGVVWGATAVQAEAGPSSDDAEAAVLAAVGARVEKTTAPEAVFNDPFV